MLWYFVFFLLSGFCSLLYELVWLRLSMAQFGVTTAMVSIVLSVFMAGLGLGSWVSGRWLRQTDGKAAPALRSYAIIELLIGVSGIAVPYGLLWGGRVLEYAGLSSSFSHYSVAGIWVALMMMPGCTLIGATLPFGMRAIAQTSSNEAPRSFSYLYMANVAGAVAGTILPLLFIEWIGFRATLKIGAACNCLIAVCALALSRKPVQAVSPKQVVKPTRAATIPSQVSNGPNILLLLFLGGLTSMAMEVVWVRRYAPYVGTVVYAFASILAIYLLATFFGSIIYRRWSSRNTEESPYLWIWLATCALLPLVSASPVVELWPLVRLILGIAPFTGLLGWITPMLVDRFSRGDSTKAGKAYAVNVTGCILGPLLAGFGLLPFLSERWALVLLTVPWIVVGLAPLRPPRTRKQRIHWPIYVSLTLASVLVATGTGFDEEYRDGRILRDSTATVIATGAGFDKQLLVNGYGMTTLTPITKVMAHLPLASLDHPPEKALVICFGMGTTFRSLRSWGIPVTAVELVPSVPRMFEYYHSDAEAVLKSPLSHVVIDDGRRFLERTSEQYDVITIDPPPPLQAAASSLLYSEEFYRLARRRLRSGGILQQWLPLVGYSDLVVVAAVVRSLHNSFPYVRAFPDEFGVHFLCSDRVIPMRTADELAARMPAEARADFTEWAPSQVGGAHLQSRLQFYALLQREFSVESMMPRLPDSPSLTDDRPVNEYYLYRQWFGRNTVSAGQESR